jgi:hypothetical protein
MMLSENCGGGGGLGGGLVTFRFMTEQNYTTLQTLNFGV